MAPSDESPGLRSRGRHGRPGSRPTTRAGARAVLMLVAFVCVFVAAVRAEILAQSSAEREGALRSKPSRHAVEKLDSAEARLSAQIASQEKALRVREHSFAVGDHIPVYAARTGPRYAPSEKYELFQALPYCRPGGPDAPLSYKPRTLWERMTNDYQVKLGYEIQFRVDQNSSELCTISLSPQQVATFHKAILNNFMSELLIDQLQVWSSVGVLPRSGNNQAGVIVGTPHLITHVHFHIVYNADTIVQVMQSTSEMVPLDAPALENGFSDLTFRYSVSWHMSHTRFLDRDDSFGASGMRKSALELEFRWKTLANSLASAVVLAVLLALVLFRQLHREIRAFHGYIRKSTHTAPGADDVENKPGLSMVYSAGADSEHAADEEHRLARLRNDLHRPPSHLSLLVACVGAGVQLLVMMVIVLALGILRFYHPLDRGAVKAILFLTYAGTLFVSGFVSGRLLKQFGGKRWIRTAILSVLVLSGPSLGVFAFINTFALFKRSVGAFGLMSSLMLVSIFLIVGIPSCLMGAIIGRSSVRTQPLSYDGSRLPRPIPAVPWYRSRLAMSMFCGLVSFSGVALEFHATLGSMWGFKSLHFFELLGIGCAVLVLYTALVSLGAMHFQLQADDYQWWWASIGYGGAPAVLMYVYSLYYYWRSPLVNSMFQFLVFSGYMFILCLFVFLLGGSIGFFSARLLLSRYFSSKSD